MNSEEILNYSLFELEEKRLLCLDLNTANQFWNQSKNKNIYSKEPLKSSSLSITHCLYQILSAFPVVTTCSLILGYCDKVIPVAYSRLTYNENLK